MRCRLLSIDSPYTPHIWWAESHPVVCMTPPALVVYVGFDMASSSFDGYRVASIPYPDHEDIHRMYAAG